MRYTGRRQNNTHYVTVTCEGIRVCVRYQEKGKLAFWFLCILYILKYLQLYNII